MLASRSGQSDEIPSTLATTQANRRQRGLALLVCLAFGAVTLGLLPVASQPAPPVPGFVPVYQSTLIVVYALTSYLFLAQHRRTGSAALLTMGLGSLFVMLMVLLQLLSFPNVLAPGRLVGNSPDTTIWLWTFWHIGPPLFALPFTLLERSGGQRKVSGRQALLAVAATLGLVVLVALAVTRYVGWLPRSVEGDDYRLLTTTGIGPAVMGLTVLALALLCWTTRLRTVLQLWLAVSLLLLVFDNLVTLSGGARGTLGWLAGRLEALVAGIILLGVYLREVDVLQERAETTARERGREKAALQSARDSLALALDAAGMGDWEIDFVTGATRRTPRHDAIFGHAQPVAGWTLDAFLAHVVPEDRAAARAALQAVEATERLDLQCRITRADDGTQRWILMRGRGYRGADGRLRSMAGVVMDTTERHEAEERLAQAQKMEAVGQLTGGVAHDFNNLLTIITGNLDMIARAPDNRARVERLAGSSLQAARRGAELTEKLLAFSRRQVLRPETVNPNRLLRDFQGLLGRAVGETVRVRLDLDPVLDPVRIDPGQFENAVLNLAVNARDAMQGGGTLTLRTCNATLSEREIADRPDLTPGPYVLVAVSDTGTGMEPAVLAHAFEPFFTTKDVGRGTGLGLSQVYGFVRQAGGYARLKSVPGEGTTVELYLPRSAEAAAPPRPDTAIPLRRATQGEVVLAVEDEPGVLEMAVESLSELGYRTLTATHAAAALDRLRGPERIDILFSDVVMPGGMNGVQLAVEARRLRPGLRVLLTSGYTGAPQNLPGDLPLLGKPYRREQLAEKLRVVLEKAS
ncbi:MASE4 domain-containing protein [Methylobacterium organophilum]|uniref:MASE4 domain-containing protein n=1 Tax=Methylobacterium organophilum TaxID=410 RepID=UPI001F13A47D|nr:MASE4 domain-containing protein [Methylobacterium organophilum]UMY16410.1 MASE4 domain-containing protein [Methylobacterium organophilum]